jgi:hypothetical protein
MMQRLIIACCAFASIAFMFVGCIEYELPVESRPAGVAEVHTASIGDSYEQRIFYSLVDRAVVASHSKMDWCLRLEPREDGVDAVLNSSRTMRLARTGLTAFRTDWTEDEVDGLAWRLDAPNGYPVDSLERVLTVGEVVLINLGHGLENDLLGRCQVQLVAMDSEACELRVANLDGTAEAIVSIPWNPDGPHGYASLLEQAARDLEPPSQTWELLLTQYSELLDGDFPYQVTGFLTPSQRVTVRDYSDLSWDDALARDWSSDSFSTDWNAIGYDWKYFDLNEGVYNIDPNRIFGVRTAEGHEFQLRILDFYDEIGNKGHFVMESVER